MQLMPSPRFNSSLTRSQKKEREKERFSHLILNDVRAAGDCFYDSVICSLKNSEKYNDLPFTKHPDRKRNIKCLRNEIADEIENGTSRNINARNETEIFMENVLPGLDNNDTYLSPLQGINRDKSMDEQIFKFTKNVRKFKKYASMLETMILLKIFYYRYNMIFVVIKGNDIQNDNINTSFLKERTIATLDIENKEIMTEKIEKTNVFYIKLSSDHYNWVSFVFDNVENQTQKIRTVISYRDMVKIFNSRRHLPTFSKGLNENNRYHDSHYRNSVYNTNGEKAQKTASNSNVSQFSIERQIKEQQIKEKQQQQQYNNNAKLAQQVSNALNKK